MKRVSVLLLLLAFGPAAAILAAEPPPTLRLPDSADRTIEPSSLLGQGEMDVRIENARGDLVIYHGMPLLEVLESNGLDVRTMAGERRSASAVVLATARSGYTVAFSVGELRSNRSNPRVFLVAETSAGPLPDSEGPVRLVVYGDVVRSAYGLSRIEVKSLAENPRGPKN
jgi:hypothetical protein